MFDPIRIWSMKMNRVMETANPNNQKFRTKISTTLLCLDYWIVTQVFSSLSSDQKLEKVKRPKVFFAFFYVSSYCIIILNVFSCSYIYLYRRRRLSLQIFPNFWSRQLQIENKLLFSCNRFCVNFHRCRRFMGFYSQKQISLHTICNIRLTSYHKFVTFCFLMYSNASILVVKSNHAPDFQLLPGFPAQADHSLDHIWYHTNHTKNQTMILLWSAWDHIWPRTMVSLESYNLYGPVYGQPGIIHGLES